MIVEVKVHPGDPRVRPGSLRNELLGAWSPASATSARTSVRRRPDLVEESTDTTDFGLIRTLNFNTSLIHGMIVNMDSGMNLNVSGEFEVAH